MLRANAIMKLISKTSHIGIKMTHTSPSQVLEMNREIMIITILRVEEIVRPFAAISALESFQWVRATKRTAITASSDRRISILSLEGE